VVGGDLNPPQPSFTKGGKIYGPTTKSKSPTGDAVPKAIE